MEGLKDAAYMRIFHRGPDMVPIESLKWPTILNNDGGPCDNIDGGSCEL